MVVRVAHPTLPAVANDNLIIENKQVKADNTLSVWPVDYGHVIAKSDSQMAAANQSGKTNKARQNPLVKLTGHTARRNCRRRSEVLWDSELPGFGLRFRPPNGKNWIVRYRERKIVRTLSLGPVSKVDAETARSKARKILAANQLDGLPTKAKVTLPKTVTFSGYVDEFLEDYGRHWKPATIYRNKYAIRRELMPMFGDMPLAAIVRSDVIRWRDDMAARAGVFNRTLPVLAVMLSYAEQLGYRRKGSNPCRGTPRYKRELSERYLSAPEYRRLAATLREAEGALPLPVAMIWLLIYTGARSGEIAGLRWEYIKTPRIFLPDSKTGAKTIYLNRHAQAVIDGLPNQAMTGLLFPGPNKKTKPFNVDPKWRTLRKRAALPDVRLHDLRHSFASVAIRDGISLNFIGKLLGHALPETTARYAHLADEAVMDAATRVCSSIATALGVRA